MDWEKSEGGSLAHKHTETNKLKTSLIDGEHVPNFHNSPWRQLWSTWRSLKGCLLKLSARAGQRKEWDQSSRLFKILNRISVKAEGGPTLPS